MEKEFLILGEIHNDLEIINKTKEKIRNKLAPLKEFEREYHKSIPKMISVIIKNLKEADTFYLRDID